MWDEQIEIYMQLRTLVSGILKKESDMKVFSCFQLADYQDTSSSLIIEETLVVFSS